MPCVADIYDIDKSGGYIVNPGKSGRKSGNIKMPEEREVDKVTRLLCSLCRSIESGQLKSVSSALKKGELRKWWKTHLRADVARKKAQHQNKGKRQRGGGGSVSGHC